MKIEIFAYGWSAEILCSDESEQGVSQIYCKTKGDSVELARSGAEWVLAAFADGRESFIRNPPEASSDKDFDTKEIHHRGFVRFSFCRHAGKRHEMPNPMPALNLNGL